MCFCQPAKRIVLNFTSVLGKRRKIPQAPVNLRCEINCKKKREVKQRRRSLRLHFLASELKKILVCSFCRSARTMIGYGNSTVSAGNFRCLSSNSRWVFVAWLDLKESEASNITKNVFSNFFNARNSRNCYYLQTRGNEKEAACADVCRAVLLSIFPLPLSTPPQTQRTP